MCLTETIRKFSSIGLPGEIVMNKIKLSGYLIAGVMLSPFLNLYSQDGETGMKIEKSVVAKKSIEENIGYLHGQLPALVKKLNLDNKEEIIYGMGGKSVPGDKTRYVYIEKAKIKLSGDSLSELTFSFTQSNEKTSVNEGREFVNKSPSDQSCKDLMIIYRNAQGETEQFSINNINSEIEKTLVLRKYLENLSEFVRWLNFYAQKAAKGSNKTIRKALLVGAV